MREENSWEKNMNRNIEVVENGDEGEEEKIEKGNEEKRRIGKRNIKSKLKGI